MRIPDAKALSQKRQWRKQVSLKDIGAQESELARLEERIIAFEDVEQKTNTDAFRWLVNELLPAEHRRICEESRDPNREGFNPGDAMKQWEIQGQLNEIVILRSKLKDVQKAIEMLHERILFIRNKVNKWKKLHEKK